MTKKNMNSKDQMKIFLEYAETFPISEHNSVHFSVEPIFP